MPGDWLLSRGCSGTPHGGFGCWLMICSLKWLMDRGMCWLSEKSSNWACFYIYIALRLRTYLFLFRHRISLSHSQLPITLLHNLSWSLTCNLLGITAWVLRLQTCAQSLRTFLKSAHIWNCLCYSSYPSGCVCCCCCSLKWLCNVHNFA